MLARKSQTTSHLYTAPIPWLLPLFDHRDVYQTTDRRSLFAAHLEKHLWVIRHVRRSVSRLCHQSWKSRLCSALWCARDAIHAQSKVYLSGQTKMS